jgi:PAS domain S-box-containing protein
MERMTTGILAVPSMPDSAPVVLAASTAGPLSLFEESAAFGTLDFDFSTGIVYWSETAFRLYGFEPGAAITLGDARARVYPEDRYSLLRAIADSVKNSGCYSTVSRVRMPDGSTGWRQLRARVTAAEDGTPLRMTGIILDITGLKDAEFSRRQTQNQVFSLIDQVSEPFLVLDRGFRFTWVNQRLLEWSGKLLHEVIGRSVYEIFLPTGGPSLYEGYRRVMEERVPSSFQVRCRGENRQESWFQVDVFPTQDGLASFLREVTELERTRQALRESDERFRRAQQAANIGAFEWNLATSRVLWAATVPTFTNVVPGDDLQTYLSFIVEEDHPALFTAIQRLQSGGQHSAEIRVRHPQGHILWLLFRAEASFDETGRPTHIYGVAMDITERKLAEEALRTTEKLAATGRLAATIAHEINNPLEAVTNLLYLAAHSVEAESEAAQYLKTAEEELERITVMVRQTLGFYRGSTSPAPVELNRTAQETLRIFEKRFLTKSIRVLADLEPQVGVHVIEGEIRQIIANLLTNAFDAVESRGKVRVHVWREGNQARFEVRDNGPGIPESVMARLFQAFFTSGKATGTGLGLWVSRDLAQKNGGSIDVQTWTEGENHGSSFILTLPLHPASESVE